MNSPRNGRTKRASSTLPLLFERQILTLDPKVEYLIVLSIFRSLLFVNVRVRIYTDTTRTFDTSRPRNDRAFSGRNINDEFVPSSSPKPQLNSFRSPPCYIVGFQSNANHVR